MRTVALIACLGSALACRRAPASQPLILFNAAALAPPFRALLADMQVDGSLPRVAQENSPSLEAVRKVTELGKIPDILATADLSLFDSLIVPRYARWYLVFGTNALVLAYTPQSARADQINEATWVDELLRPGVRTGRSDPRIDPSGYRTLMALQLAERYYGRPGLEAALLDAMPDRYVRRAEADLSAVLQAGELDYIWTYRNLAKAHGLQWLELPPEINLEQTSLAAWYAHASVSVPGAPNSPPLRLIGAPIAFGLTIPAGAPSPAAAAQFVARLLSSEGRTIMRDAGFTMLDAPYLIGSGAPPPIARAVARH